MTNLHRLHSDHDQSPWLDDLSRDLLRSGRLAELISGGIRGVTANPTILAKAITGSDAYDSQLATLAARATSATSAFWSLAVDDVVEALDLFRTVHDESGGRDGFVSLELAPDLADDTTASVAAAENLTLRIGRPNLLVKVPATDAGVAAVRAATAAGLSINVTLIFSLGRYAQIIDAYLSGLEQLAAAGGDLTAVRSVASFFLSRVDTEVARRAGTATGPPATSVAVSQAKVAYAMFNDAFTSERWARLAALGATEQRPLWASTSTKDPALSDTHYVDALIGPKTVTTLPEATIAAFVDHGHVARTVDVDVDAARAHLDHVEAVGVDLADVGVTLERSGVAAFRDAFDSVVELLARRLRDLNPGGVDAA